MKVIPEPRRVN